MYVFKNINVKAKIWNFAHKNTKLYAKGNVCLYLCAY